MALEMQDKRAIIAYRLEKADSVMIEAKDNAGLKHWTLAANRLFYSRGICGNLCRNEKRPFRKAGFAVSKRFLFLAWQGDVHR
jgi:hypothetical protein